jgi:hypothetical protein
MGASMTTITKAELLDLAKSNDPAVIKQAFDVYHAWLKAAPNLPIEDRINGTERLMFDRLFKSKLKPTPTGSRR